MLKRRLIPKLQLRAASYAADQMVLVTTRKFNAAAEIGDAVSQAKIYESQAVDELIFLDLDATREGRATRDDVVRQAAEQIFMPFTVGGGVRELADFRRLLSCGADKVSINSAAIENPLLITEASEAFGAQCVVVSIDYRRVEDGSMRVCSRAGRVLTDLDPVAWALAAEQRGAGEILLTSIDQDGTCSGLELDVLREVAQRVSIPVIASGGCGLASHFVEGFMAGADAVSAGTYFCAKDQNPMQARAHIRNAKIPVRLLT